MGKILNFSHNRKRPLDWRERMEKKPRPSLLRVAGAGLIAGGLIAVAFIYAPGLVIPTPNPPMPADRIEFGICSVGGGVNCVVDGDTFWMGGQRIRIADIDAPETHPPRCPAEAELGNRATIRLRELLNAGPVALEAVDRDEDVYGRKLRIVTRDGRSVGRQLVSEGLARDWTGSRRPWCPA